MLSFVCQTLGLKRVCSWHPRRVEQLQRKRLAALVRIARARSPYFRRLYQGIDPAHLCLSDLPPTTKSDLMANFDDAVTDRSIRRGDLERFIDNPENEGRLFLGRFAVSHTSGSQGQPLLMVSGPDQLDLVFGVQMTRGSVRPTSPLEAIRRFVNPARLAVVTLKRGFYPSASAFEYMPAHVRKFVNVLRLSQTDDDLVERLNGFRPTVLTGYASVLEMLALEVETGRLNLRPELVQVFNNSEVLTDKARARIEAAFGMHVLNNYATGECPFLTNGCRTREGAHVNHDWAILEVVDADNRPVPDGTAGAKVLITNLRNHVQPIIRYEVGDMVTMATEPCGCGNGFPRIARIEGRAADTFWIRGGDGYKQVINSVFKNAFDYTREVREWQAIQTDRNTVVVKLEVLPGHELDEGHAWWSLRRQLEMYGFAGVVDVSLEVVDRLAPDAKTGKFRRMISRVGPPAEFSSRPKIRFDAPEPLPAPRVRASGARARFETEG